MAINFILPNDKLVLNAFAAIGQAPGSANLAAHRDFIKAAGTAAYVQTLSQILDQAGVTNAALAEMVIANYGLSTVTELSAATLEAFFAANAGNRAAAVLQLADIISSYSGTTYASVRDAFNANIQTAYTYASTAGNVADKAFTTTAFALTAGNDILTGTALNDTFTANFSGNTNALDSGDVIDGAAGTDTLKAIIESGPFSLTPTLTNIENITVTAQNDVERDSGQNNVSAEEAVQLDFGRVSGIKTIVDFDSRADLSVEDVRILDSEITKDITIVMRDTDPGAVDYAVYFDQNSLRNVSNSTSLINLRVLDTYAVAQGLDPLKDSPYGSFKFSYSIDGAAAQTATLASDAIQNAKTFAEMVTALQAAADGVFGAGVVTVTTGSTYTVPDSVTNKNVQGTEIVLSAKGNIKFDTTVAGSGWLATDTVPAVSGLYTSYNTNVQSTTALVTSTIVLDNVGRGSNGGDLIVGGLSNGETSSSKGVQRFDITVEDNSKLSNILSTNNTLREVYIVNGVTDEKSDAYTTTVANKGNLTVGVNNDQNSALDSGTQNFEDSEFGFNDVRVIDGSAMTGKLAFTAAINATSLDKYLDLKDTANDPAADNVAFVYSGGSNDDTMTVSIDAAVAGSVGRLSTREDFSFTINGGAGKDAITVSTLGTPSANSVLAQKQYDNITVNGGDGDDTIKTPANADMKINAGAGNDTVYTDNSAYVAGDAAGNRAVWLVSSANTDLVDLETVVANDTNIFLYKGKLTVTYAPQDAAVATNADAANGADNNGFSVTVDIPTGSNYSVNQYYLNQAIKAAINNDPVLSKLLEAIDGPGNTLRINALTDGAHEATGNDLLLTVAATAPVAASADETAMTTAFQAFSHNSAANAAAANAAVAASVTDLNNNEGMTTGQVLALNGTNSATDVDNIINLGTGDDVLVLSTNATSVETIKFDTTSIGKNTIVNFTDAQDVLDFTAWLDNVTSASGSTVSQQRIATALEANVANLNANEVAFTTFDAIVTAGTLADSVTFANLTGAQVLTALNAAGGYGSSAAVANFVGTTQKAILLVLNQDTAGTNLSDNDGEYLVVEVSFGTTAVSNGFTAATIVGSVDFGDTIAAPALA